MPCYVHRNESGTGFQAWFFGNPRTEAKALFEMLGRNGDTVESLWELIRISPQEQTRLKECAARYPDLADHIERALQYRAKVEAEFEALCSTASGDPKGNATLLVSGKSFRAGPATDLEAVTLAGCNNTGILLTVFPS